MNSALAILLTLVSTTLPGETGFMDAYNQARLGKHGDAIKLYLQVAKDDADLAPYALIRAARSRSRGGDDPGAIRELKTVLRVYPDGPWTRWAHHEIATLYNKSRFYTQAAPHYAEAVDNDAKLWWIDDVRLKQAKNNIEVPELKREAMGYFRELLDTTVWHKKRLTAARYLAKSDRAEDRIHATLGLLRSGKYQEARSVAAAIPKNSPDAHVDRARLRLEARLLITRCKKTEGRKRLEALALEFPREPWADEALLYTVRSYITAEQWLEADRLVRQLLKSYPDSDKTREAMLRIARAHAKYDHTDRAITWYRRRVSMFPKDKDNPTAVLEAGDAYRKENRDQEAIGMYDQLLNDYPNSNKAADAGFWAGILLQKNGQSRLAKERFQKSTGSGLTHYYGFRSQEILATSFDLPAEQAPRLRITQKESLVRPIIQPGSKARFNFAKVEKDKRFQRLKYFAHNGFLEAEWESLDLIQAVHDHAEPNLMYTAIGEAGTSYSAMQWADSNDFGVNEDGTQTIERMRIRYPRPYWDYVSALARELRLDPYIILSIARQESTYRPGLTSSAGAKGVMQLMPRTAKWLGDTDKLVSRNSAQRLDEPRHSLRMGSVYFKRMLDRSKGNIAFALASYNAGPGNFDNWRRRNPNQSTAEFIESIPFTETQNYVKRILAHYSTYKSIYPE